MAASNTRFTQNSLGQSKTPIDSDHGIYRASMRVLRILTLPGHEGAFLAAVHRTGPPERTCFTNVAQLVAPRLPGPLIERWACIADQLQ